MAETFLYLVFCGLSCVFWPIYFLLLVCIVYDRTRNSRFSSTFHNLLLSLGVGDLLAMLSFAYMRLVRNQFPEVFWEHRTAYWAAPFGYNHIYYWLFVRCFGAALISFQRYVTVCLNTTKLNEVMHKLNFWKIFLLHWVPPTLYSIPIITNSNITYDNITTFNTIILPSDAKYSVNAGNAWCLGTFLVCVTCYLLVLRLFRSAKLNRSLRKELRITIQVAGPVLAIVCAFSFYLIQAVFAYTRNTNGTFVMRNIYPLITAFMSYINPLTYLIFSEDLRKLIWNTFCCSRYQLEMSTNSKVKVVARPSTIVSGQ